MNTQYHSMMGKQCSNKMRKWLKQKKRKRCNGMRFTCNSGSQCRGQIARVLASVYFFFVRLFCHALCFLVYVYGLLNWNFFHARNREKRKRAKKRQRRASKAWKDLTIIDYISSNWVFHVSFLSTKMDARNLCSTLFIIQHKTKGTAKARANLRHGWIWLKLYAVTNQPWYILSTQHSIAASTQKIPNIINIPETKILVYINFHLLKPFFCASFFLSGSLSLSPHI